MKIVFLDRKTIGNDIDLSGFFAIAEVEMYDFTRPEEAPARVADADILVVNKTPINKETIGDASRLKLVCVTATGTNNLDKAFLTEKGIAWRNVAGYSTECVAQHTFAMLFYLVEHIRYYDDYVKNGHYAEDFLFTHFARSFHEIAGKVWGIIGLGAIGRRVAQIAAAFGTKVRYYSTSGKNHTEDYEEVSFEKLLSSSDIISIHAPLNESTERLIDKRAFSLMKPNAILLNLGRGPIVVEEDLAQALKKKQIAGAGLDVLCAEPMNRKSPFLQMGEYDNLLITPHIAWASLEARQRLMDTILTQIKEEEEKWQSRL